MSNGKGSKPRPFSVPFEEFEKTWDNIFKKLPKANPEPDERKKPKLKDRNWICFRENVCLSEATHKHTDKKER